MPHPLCDATMPPPSSLLFLKRPLKFPSERGDRAMNIRCTPALSPLKERARACERWSFVLHLFTCPPPPPRAPTGVRRPTGCACRSVVQKMGTAKHYPAKHLSKGISHRVSDVSGVWGPVCGPSGLRRIHTPWTGAFCKPAHCVVAPAWGLRGQMLSEESLVSWISPLLH